MTETEFFDYRDNQYFALTDEAGKERDFIESESCRIFQQLPESIFDFISPSVIRDLKLEDLELHLDDARIDRCYQELLDLIATNTAKENFKRYQEEQDENERMHILYSRCAD